MRGIRIWLSGMAVAAVLVVVLPASGASAAPKLLVISEGGKPLAVGAPVKIADLVGPCSVWSTGTVTANSATKDKATGVEAFSECAEGVTASGAITEIQMGSNGKYTMKGKVSLTKPGPCTYTFSKWKGEFTIPGATLIEGKTVEGKLNKKLSQKTGCAPTTTQEYNAGITSPEFELYEEALKV